VRRPVWGSYACDCWIYGLIPAGSQLDLDTFMPCEKGRRPGVYDDDLGLAIPLCFEQIFLIGTWI
jgi:hypothetical protein